MPSKLSSGHAGDFIIGEGHNSFTLWLRRIVNLIAVFEQSFVQGIHIGGR